MDEGIDRTIEDDAESTGPLTTRERIHEVFESDRAFGFFQYVVLLNLIFLFTKPQVLMPVLAATKFPIVLFLLSFVLMLTRLRAIWTFPVKMMSAFLILHAGFIFYGKVIDDDFIVNDFQAYDAWQTLLQIFGCFLFPVMAFCGGPRGAKRLVKVMLYSGLFLGVYVLLNNGRGPGDFVGDENDVCVVLVTLLPLPLMLLQSRSTAGTTRKSFLLIVLLCLLGGIVQTRSRGGFIGLVAVILSCAWLSPRKWQLFAVFGAVLLFAAPFVPADYWAEIRSISDTETGTALKRRQMWEAAFRAWLDFPNAITGVGIDNIPWRIGEYEGPEAGVIRASYAGRQVHSLGIQILADLGLIGIFMIGWLVVRSIRDGRALLTDVRIARTELNAARPVDHPNESSTLDESPSADEFGLDLGTREKIVNELNWLEGTLLAGNLMWLGHFAAGFFVSVLYYPTLWFLSVFAACIQSYTTTLRDSMEEFLDVVDNEHETRAL